MKVKTLLGTLGSISLLISACADDWPQWQGPDRNAISKETGLLKEWPAAGPPLAWKKEQIGGGDSAPSIATGRIFGMGNRGADEVIWALSEKDGKQLWSTRLGPAFEQGWPQGKEGPACTPTVDGDHVYVIGLAGNVVCLKVEDGTVIWQKNLVSDFSGTLPTWSYRESPLIDGNKLICTPGSDDAMLVALDKLTGATIWKSKAPDTSSGDSGRRGDSPRGRDAGPANAGGRNAASATVVTGTKDPDLFQSEHWGMRTFSCEIPNGKYLAKLYFAETYEGITGPGQRVFSLNVQGHELKDFDIWAKAGGSKRAYIETVPVEVTNGEFRIAFTPQKESPAINAIEVIPQAEPGAATATSPSTIRIKAGRTTPFTDSLGQVWQPEKGFEGGMAGGPGVMRGPGLASGPPTRGNFGPGGFGGGPGGGGSGAAYASAIAFDFEGQREYVQMTAHALIGVAASDGKFLWKYERPANRMGINCSTPIYREGVVFAASAYNAGGGAVRLGKKSDGTVTAEEAWFSRQMENHHGGVLIIDGALYGANGGNGGGYLACLDFKTGEVLWNEADREKRRLRKGSVAFADGRIYYRTEQGAVVLIEPSRKEYIERGRFEQPDRTGSPAWAHPVIANGKLYLRDQETLFCYNVKAP